MKGKVANDITFQKNVGLTTKEQKVLDIYDRDEQNIQHKIDFITVNPKLSYDESYQLIKKHLREKGYNVVKMW